ncbi:MAG: hypothetical protein ACI4OP_03815 [Candidatus Coprovivens sp.]
MCISETEYEALPIKNEDTYYYTYSDKDLQDTGYVRSEFLYEKFYTKAEVDEIISSVVAQLRSEISTGGSSINEEVLTL